MTTIQITKPHPVTEPKDDTIKASTWSNLLFLKNRSTYGPFGNYPSEQEARKAIEDWEALCRHLMASDRRYRRGFIKGMSFRFCEYSHAIQTPARAA